MWILELLIRIVSRIACITVRLVDKTYPVSLWEARSDFGVEFNY